MSKRVEDTSGITSRDISAMITHIEDEHYGHCIVELRMAPTRFSASANRLVVVAANYVGTYRTARNTRASVQATFPHNRYKTMLACIFQLLHELDDALETQRRQKRGAAPEENQTQTSFV